ncbi:MAG TPA: hypothetical protein VJK26_01840 [Patescibacteria group bacterium]|nr:hypothetical protein [Patescibacteria group bacterium]
MQTRTPAMIDGGAHDGGMEKARCLEKAGTLKAVRVREIIGKTDIYDPERDRAIFLASCYRHMGIDAEGHETTIEEASEIPTSLRGLYIDDLGTMNRAISLKPNEDEFQFNYLMGTGFPRTGGQVVSVLGNIDRQDEDSRHYGQLLIEKTNQLAGEVNRSSREMMLPTQAQQMDRTRTVAHFKLAEEAVNHFSGKTASSGLWLAETFTPILPNIYPAKVVVVKDQPNADVCLERAIAIAENAGEKELAVVFLHQTAPWLHVEFLVKEPTWTRRDEFTFPVSPGVGPIVERAMRPLAITD